VTVTGATGLIGRPLVAALLARGDEVTVLTRDPERALAALDGGQRTSTRAREPQALRWEPTREAAPSEALSGRDAVVHLAGESIARRWSASARRAIHDSRVLGTRNLVAGLRAADESPDGRRPRVLVSASAIGYYGARGEEPLDEESPPGEDFLAQVCAKWEAAAQEAASLGMRVVTPRTGVVLDRGGGALARMLPAFRLGLGGPIASGRQYVSWIHRVDVVALVCAALDDERWLGPINATAPEPVSSREFARVLGRVLKRPALLPLPAGVLRLLFGEMAQIITTGARAVPAKPLVLGYEFRYPRLEQALRAELR
jgi:uncharacterized protein